MPPIPEVPAGELVLLTGRRTGQRRPLNSAATLIGQAPGCDLCLTGPNVCPQHCVIVAGRDGLWLRDLHGDGTLVNGQPLTDGPLQDGDRLTIGPFEFQVWCPLTPAAVEQATPLVALRIQAAAVAAQQAALVEDEVRLHDRRSALDQQEQQLAAHLDEKRQQLLELQAQIGEARAQLKQERSDLAAQVDEQARELSEVRTEAAEELRLARTQRQRLQRLHARFLQRWKRHWATERLALQGKADELKGAAEKLAQDRSAFERFRLGFNGDAELTRRQLQEQREQLLEDRERWRDERAAADERDRTMAARQANLDAAERAIADVRRRAEEQVRVLAREAAGLEQRIIHGRRALAAQGHECHRPDATLPKLAVLPPRDLETSQPRSWPADVERQRHLLRRLLAELGDQRLLLAEQAERLADARAVGTRDIVGLLIEIEATAEDLAQRETETERRSQGLDLVEERFREERDAVQRLRLNLEGRLARQTVRDVELRAREGKAERLQQSLGELCRRWAERRRQDLERLRAELARCEQAQQEWAEQTATACGEWRALRRRQQVLTEQELALEQGRQELLAKADRPPDALKRMQKLERRWAMLSAAGEQELEQRRQQVETESAKLAERLKQVHTRLSEVAHREAKLADRRSESERQRAESATLELWPAQRERYEQQLAELRNEVERLALLLIDESTAVARAA